MPIVFASSIFVLLGWFWAYNLLAMRQMAQDRVQIKAIQAEARRKANLLRAQPGYPCVWEGVIVGRFYEVSSLSIEEIEIFEVSELPGEDTFSIGHPPVSLR